MGRPRLCKAKECSSEGDKRKAAVEGLCRACYMRRWRRRKAAEPATIAPPTLEEVEAALAVEDLILVPPSTPVDGETAGARQVREFLQRQAALLRRATVLKMLRRGMEEAEILWHFYTNEDLRRAYIDSSAAPLVVLRRDFDALKGAGR